LTAKKSTSVRSFFDTNVLVYTDDGDTPEKQRAAIDLLARARSDGSGVVSTQILQEYFAASTRKLGVEATVARRKVELFSRYNIILVDVPEILAATDLHIIHGVSFWDGLVIACAKRAGCRVLYSEDLQAGRSFEGMEIVNPFA
jgi:predicted nucleic acid-binding protein